MDWHHIILMVVGMHGMVGTDLGELAMELLDHFGLVLLFVMVVMYTVHIHYIQK